MMDPLLSTNAERRTFIGNRLNRLSNCNKSNETDMINLHDQSKFFLGPFYRNILLIFICINNPNQLLQSEILPQSLS